MSMDVKRLHAGLEPAAIKANVQTLQYSSAAIDISCLTALYRSEKRT
jgi:hypothetical protein